MNTDTIIAQTTPQGVGALAMLRMSGKDVFQIMNQCVLLASKKSLLSVDTHTVHYGSVYSADGELLDTVLCMVMHAPKTFTGENSLEITCHNNPFIVQAIIEVALHYGARLARPGEFTQRAVLHGKMDLLQAESIHELVSAHSETLLKKALSQSQGSLSAWVFECEQKLLTALSYTQASFEFVEEEGADFQNQVKSIILQLQKTLEAICAHFKGQEHVRQGIRIALVGSVNVGKSSLFNSLIGKDRAIVTPIAGTTRDALEATVHRNGLFLTFVDTAGLRQTDDVIESMGIEQSYKEAELCDVLLLVYDASRELSEAEISVYMDLKKQYSSKCIILKNKSDLLACSELQKNVAQEKNIFFVSGKHDHNLAIIHECIDKKISDLKDKAELPFVLNNRHYSICKTLLKKIESINILCKKTFPYELVSHHLLESLTCVADLSGKTVSEAAMDQIFKQFCVGK